MCPRKFRCSLAHAAAGCCEETEKALQDDRVKGNPGITKAPSSSGQLNTDLVISNEDAETITAEASTLNRLRSCKVIFVIE